MISTIIIATLLAYFYCLIMDQRDTEEVVTIGIITIISLILLLILLKLGVINL